MKKIKTFLTAAATSAAITSTTYAAECRSSVHRKMQHRKAFQ